MTTSRILAIFILFLLTFVASAAIGAQDRPPPSAAFERPQMPTPNSFRTASGEPGTDYWQQRVDYYIDVTLRPEDHRVSGSQTITYTNNSPDDLHYLWLAIDQNRFDIESRGETINPPDARFRGGFAGGGMDITLVEIELNGNRYQPAHYFDDTRMRIRLDEPLQAGGSTAEIDLEWTFVQPEFGADRTGRIELNDGWLYQIAQWYPRMFVYDDVRGWDPLPYLGQGEFYMGYGDFEVDITVPYEMIVAATGELTNAEEVLTDIQRERLETARTSEDAVYIVRPDEVGTPESRPASEGELTWRFRAENVRDFAWAASSSFIWDAAGWEDVLNMSYYPRDGLGSTGEPGWEESTLYTRHSISFYSEFLAPYPYPVAINVAGPVLGMEYPMVSFCAYTARGQALFGVTDHEFGHMWFPMIVGSDERRYMWLDEGLNSYMNYYSNHAFYGAEAQRLSRMEPNYIAILSLQDTNGQHTMTRADKIAFENLGFLAYRKPGFGLVLLREYILGPDRFDEAFRTYYERWAFKHPHPADFFRTIEDVSGEDLSWFWRGWFYSTDRLDQSIDSVSVNGNETHIYLSNREGQVMPVELEIAFEDGTSERRRLPVETWFTRHTFELVVESEFPVAEVTIDPNRLLPDIDRTNNRWIRDDGPAGTGRP